MVLRARNYTSVARCRKNRLRGSTKWKQPWVLKCPRSLPDRATRAQSCSHARTIARIVLTMLLCRATSRLGSVFPQCTHALRGPHARAGMFYQSWRVVAQHTATIASPVHACLACCHNGNDRHVAKVHVRCCSTRSGAESSGGGGGGGGGCENMEDVAQLQDIKPDAFYDEQAALRNYFYFIDSQGTSTGGVWYLRRVRVQRSSRRHP